MVAGGFSGAAELLLAPRSKGGIHDAKQVLLPCNVIVRDAGADQAEVAAIDPVTSMDRTGKPELAGVADEVRLQRAVERV